MHPPRHSPKYPSSCPYCGVTIQQRSDSSKDHVVPKSAFAVVPQDALTIRCCNGCNNEVKSADDQAFGGSVPCSRGLARHNPAMCGRYTHKLTWQQIVNLYRLTLPDEPPPQLQPTYNAAPTQALPIIRPSGNGRELVMAGWGLIPYWLKIEDLGKRPYATINARAETIRTSPTYHEPFKKRRCLVPATGWYVWQDVRKKKTRPIHMCAKAEPFAFAGVWDAWKGDGGPGIISFAIVTTAAAPSVSVYRSRMPVVLGDAQFDQWMLGTPDEAATLMVPYEGAIEAWEVSPDVGSPKNNRPELLDRVGLL